MTDREILALYLARDESAITRTKERFGTFLRSIAWNILHSHEDAEECENDAYFAAWRHIPPAEPEPLRPYLGAIVRNAALQKYAWYTADKRSRNLEEAFEELDGSLGAPETMDERLDLERLGQSIDAFLRRASREARVIFLRRYWFADSIDEIAARLHVSQSKVKSSLFRTRSALREFLRKEGYTI